MLYEASSVSQRGVDVALEGVGRETGVQSFGGAKVVAVNVQLDVVLALHPEHDLDVHDPLPRIAR